RNLGGITTRPFSSRAYSASPLSIRLRAHPAPHLSLRSTTFLHYSPISFKRNVGPPEKGKKIAASGEAATPAHLLDYAEESLAGGSRPRRGRRNGPRAAARSGSRICRCTNPPSPRPIRRSPGLTTLVTRPRPIGSTSPSSGSRVVGPPSTYRAPGTRAGLRSGGGAGSGPCAAPSSAKAETGMRPPLRTITRLLRARPEHTRRPKG